MNKFSAESKEEASSSQEPQQATPKAKRIRERTIQDVIKSVALWRRLYNGVMKNDGNTLIRYTLDDAAKKIGISKKTLDDYLHLLRLGKQTKFDFKASSNLKVGALRKHIKIQKMKAKKTGNPVDSGEESD